MSKVLADEDGDTIWNEPEELTSMKSEDERIAIDEIDLILAELQNYMVNVPATMKAKAAIESLLREARVDELQLLLEDWDMAEREPGDQKIHEYKDFETIRERIAQLTQDQPNGSR